MYFRGSQVTHEEACGKSHITELGRRARNVTMKLRTNLTSVYKRPEKENSHSQPLPSVLFEGGPWQCPVHQELCHYRTLQTVQVNSVCPLLRKVHCKVSKYRYFQIDSPAVLSPAVFAILFISFCLLVVLSDQKYACFNKFP